MSSSLSARAEQFPNPFMEQAQAVVEFSRGLSSALKGANHQRKDAFFQFFTRQLPKQAIRELVPEFNKAVREYNRNRNKLKAMLTRGDGIQPEDKLFTVEENLKNAMRTFQRIKDLLLVYPRLKSETMRNLYAPTKTEKVTIGMLRTAGYSLAMATILVSCTPPPAEIIPAPDQEEGEENQTQSAQDLIDSTEEGQEIDPATLEAPKIEATSTVTADQLLDLNSDIELKTVEAQEQAQETDLMAWANNQALRSAESRTPIFSAALTSPENPEDAVLDPGSFDIVVLPSGRIAAIINVDSVWGPAGTVAVIDTGENQGMFATEEGAIRSALGITSDAEVKVALEKYEVLFEKTEDVGIDQSLYYAVLREKGPNGKIIKVIDATRQWVDLNKAKPLQNAGVAELLRALESGEVENLDGLSEEGKIQLSEAVASNLNSARKDNPAVYNNEAVIDPETGKLLNYDGHADESEVIEMYWSYAGRDESGNVKMKRGNETITIQNSAGIENWEEIYTDPNDPRIEWPKTKIPDGQTLTQAQILMNPERFGYSVLRVCVPVGTTVGEIYVEGHGKISGLRMLILEDDGSGNIIFGREIIVVPSPVLRVFEGGESTDVSSPGPNIQEYSEVWEQIKRGSLYYMGIKADQEEILEKVYSGTPSNYSGLIHGQEAFDVVSGNSENNKDMLLLTISYLMGR